MARARPFRNCLRQINAFASMGYYICISTSRTNAHRKVTKTWLREHRVQYDKVIFNKPRITGIYSGYHYIDNADVMATRYVGNRLPEEL